MTEKQIDTAPQQKTVTLDTPVIRGKEVITSVTLRKPQSGALRGTRLQALMDMDVNAMMTLIPRISLPALQPHEIVEMDPADLLALSVEVVTFLLPKSALSAFPTA
ncbi:phage tail assembly protein [[Erwinia] mediterraneensis]|uniref:phage tail assembly protein n=1 Tax=[Erwinia] mediterraneensis TaxID=2161819 RepID=UPI00102F7D71|nr:phage tail assembly protein [[Erwinia] mediterraneensis]